MSVPFSLSPFLEVDLCVFVHVLVCLVCFCSCLFVCVFVCVQGGALPAGGAAEKGQTPFSSCQDPGNLPHVSLSTSVASSKVLAPSSQTAGAGTHTPHVSLPLSLSLSVYLCLYITYTYIIIYTQEYAHTHTPHSGGPDDEKVNGGQVSYSVRNYSIVGNYKVGFPQWRVMRCQYPEAGACLLQVTP